MVLSRSVAPLSHSSPQRRVKTFTRHVALWLSTQASVNAKSRPWLQGTPTSLPLLSKEKVSPDTSLYRFGLEPTGESKLKQASKSENITSRNDADTLGLKVCSCILVTSPNNESLTRPYTPVSGRHQIGSFDLLVKTYPDGAMGKEFEKLEPGDDMIFKQISFNIKEQYPFGNPDTIIMLAAGTGITPMWQALNRMFGADEQSKDDTTNLTTRVKLFYGCRKTTDILLRKELDELQNSFPHRFEVHYAISEDKMLKESNKLMQGRLDKATVERLCSNDLPQESDRDVRVWICGPPSFYDTFCGKRSDEALPEDSILSELGFRSEKIVKF